MKTSIVTEGVTDARFLAALLRDAGVHDIQLFHPGGWRRAEALARSLLVVRPGRVALVLDADGVLDERRGFVEESLWEVEPNTERWKLLFFEPDLEGFIARHVPELVPEVGRQDAPWATLLTKERAALLRARSPLLPLLEFLRASQEEAA